MSSAEREGLSLKGNVPNLRFPEFGGEWYKCRLRDVASYCKERINTSHLSVDNYISTDNMLQNYEGIKTATSIPSEGNSIAYSIGDILFSNIRPYLKKVWLAEKDGGCSTDVLVVRPNGRIDNNFLYHIIANDSFINYAMSGAKGVKMPRGDR